MCYLTGTATEVIETVSGKIGLRDPSDGWALFEVTPQSEHFIRGQEYLGDVLAEWESAKRSSMSMTRYQVTGRCSCVCGCSGLWCPCWYSSVFLALHRDCVHTLPRAATLTPPQTMSRNKASPTSALGGGDAKFVFRKRLFRRPQEIPTDPVEYGLLYSQAVHSVVRVDEFPVNDKVALQLAGLQAQVLWGDSSEKNISRYEEVRPPTPTAHRV